jgi:hypothetical protein
VAYIRTKASQQHMKQESTHELIDRKPHEPFLVGGVSPTESDLFVDEKQEVGWIWRHDECPAQITTYLVGPTEGLFAVDHAEGEAAGVDATPCGRASQQFTSRRLKEAVAKYFYCDWQRAAIFLYNRHEMRDNAKTTSATKGLRKKVATIEFATEEQLLEAIRALLTRIPNVELAQITHGRLERGKDIIFVVPGGLGPSIPCACVVKNTLLSGKVGSNNAALTVLHQVEQAFLNPIQLETGASLNIQRVYIVTPYDLTADAIASIEGHLRDQKGRIQFIGGTMLLDLIRKYWPDFFADEFTALRDNIRATAQRLEDERPLHYVSFRYHLSAPDRNISRYYVHPSFYQDFTVFNVDFGMTLNPRGEFPFVTKRNPHGRKGEEWIPVQPERRVVSKAIIATIRNHRSGVSISHGMAILQTGRCGKPHVEPQSLRGRSG